MKDKLFTQLKNSIKQQMIESNGYETIQKSPHNESEGVLSTFGECVNVNDIEYFFDVTGVVVKSGGSEVGTTFGYDQEMVSYDPEIEYELTDCYYYVRNEARKINIQVSANLTDQQIKTINEILNS